MRAKGLFVASLKMRAYAQWMGLTLAERRAITEAAATRYQLAGKRGKGRILDELCANTGATAPINKRARLREATNLPSRAS